MGFHGGFMGLKRGFRVLKGFRCFQAFPVCFGALPARESFPKAEKSAAHQPGLRGVNLA